MFAKSSLVWSTILFIYSNKDISAKLFKKKIQNTNRKKYTKHSKKNSKTNETAL